MQTVVFKALKLTQMENDLLDINREIKYREGVINSVKTFPQHKKKSKKELIKLIKRRKVLVDNITEMALLND